MPSTGARVRKTPEQRRAEVERAARELALEEGLAAVTLRAIAARVGVVPGLVAHYAPSMDELVAATFAAIAAAELAELRELLSAESTAARAIDALLDTLGDGGRDDVTLVWVQAWAIGAGNPALAAAVRIQMDAWLAVIEAVVTRGIAEGSFRVDDASAAARNVLALVDGLNAHALVHWRADPASRALTRRAVGALLGARGAETGHPTPKTPL